MRTDLAGLPTAAARAAVDDRHRRGRRARPALVREPAAARAAGRRDPRPSPVAVSWRPGCGTSAPQRRRSRRSASTAPADGGAALGRGRLASGKQTGSSFTFVERGRGVLRARARRPGPGWRAGRCGRPARPQRLCRAAGSSADLVPEQANAAGLVDRVPEAGDGGGCSSRRPIAPGRNWPTACAAKGWTVDVVEAYRTVDRRRSRDASWPSALDADALCLTSASTATGWARRARDGRRRRSSSPSGRCTAAAAGGPAASLPRQRPRPRWARRRADRRLSSQPGRTAVTPVRSTAWPFPNGACGGCGGRPRCDGSSPRPGCSPTTSSPRSSFGRGSPSRNRSPASLASSSTRGTACARRSAGSPTSACPPRSCSACRPRRTPRAARRGPRTASSRSRCGTCVTRSATTSC